jgi:hypothetical protein
MTGSRVCVYRAVSAAAAQSVVGLIRKNSSDMAPKRCRKHSRRPVCCRLEMEGTLGVERRSSVGGAHGTCTDEIRSTIRRGLWCGRRIAVAVSANSDGRRDASRHHVSGAANATGCAARNGDASGRSFTPWIAPRRGFTRRG